MNTIYKTFFFHLESSTDISAEELNIVTFSIQRISENNIINETHRHTEFLHTVIKVYLHFCQPFIDSLQHCCLV